MKEFLIVYIFAFIFIWGIISLETTGKTGFIYAVTWPLVLPILIIVWTYKIARNELER